MSSETESTIRALAEQVRDANQPLQERKEALRHICQLRNESSEDVETITEDELSPVVSGMVNWPDGVKPLSLRDSLEALREGRRRRPERRIAVG